MGLKYAFFHLFVHLLIAFILAIIVASNLTEYFLIFLFTFLIDLDHLQLIRKYGILGTFWLRAVTEFKKPRRYFLHNIHFIISLFLTASIAFYYNFFAWKIFLAVLLHLLWDLFEDGLIFKIGIKHWK